MSDQKGTETSTSFATRLLHAQNVAVAPGDTFGTTASRFVRVSLATDTERLQEGMRRLCEFIRS